MVLLAAILTMLTAYYADEKTGSPLDRYNHRRPYEYLVHSQPPWRMIGGVRMVRPPVPMRPNGRSRRGVDIECMNVMLVYRQVNGVCATNGTATNCELTASWRDPEVYSAPEADIMSNTIILRYPMSNCIPSRLCQYSKRRVALERGECVDYRPDDDQPATRACRSLRMLDTESRDCYNPSTQKW